MIAGVIFLTAGVGPQALAAEVPQPITFVRDERIVTTNAQGAAATPLVPRGGRSYAGDGQPAWDPSGRTLYFSRARRVGRDDEAAQVHFLAPDGLVRRLTPRTRGYEASPRVSPSGAELAFVRYREARESFMAEIVVRSLFTGAERVVVRRRFLLGGIGDPQWAHEGKSLLYTETKLDRRYYFRPSLRVVDLDRTGDRLLRRDAEAGRYSPDGRRLAFVSVADRNGQTCGSDQCEYNGELYVMNAEGTDARRLTRNEGADGAPSWSDDGRRLTFASTRNYPDGERPEIYSISPDGSCLTWLTNGTQASYDPAWRPGGGNSDPAGCGAASRQPLYTTDERPLRRVRAFDPLWLGRSFGSMMLSDVDLDREGLFLHYADCSAFEPEHCFGGIQLSAQSVCEPRQLELMGSSGRLRGFRGVPIENFGSEAGYEVYSGRAVFGLGLDNTPLDERVALRAHRPALRALRPYPLMRAAARLPAARLPAPVVRRVRRASRLRRRLGSVQAVAEVTGSHVSVVRRRLEIARALDRLPRGRPVRCRR